MEGTQGLATVLFFFSFPSSACFLSSLTASHALTYRHSHSMARTLFFASRRLLNVWVISVMMGERRCEPLSIPPVFLPRQPES